MMKRSPLSLLVVIIIALLVAVHGSGSAAEIMSLKDCIETARRNQPAIRTARENIRAGQGRQTQAASPYFPQLTRSTGYTENHSPMGGAFGESITKAYVTTL